MKKKQQKLKNYMNVSKKQARTFAKEPAEHSTHVLKNTE